MEDQQASVRGQAPFLMTLQRSAEAALKAFAKLLGVDVRRLKNVPKETLAGLAQRPVRTIIDCGANEGQFARYITRYFPSAQLYCFEPLPVPFSVLSKWAASEGPRVRCFQLALGEYDGTADMNFHVAHSSSSSLLPTTDHNATLFPDTAEQVSVTVPMTSLDGVMTDHFPDMEGEILLKLDVQGYEDRVLRGGQELLRRVDICILEISSDPLYQGQANFKDVLLQLDARGLHYVGNLDQSYADDGRIMWFDALFVRG